MKNLINKEDCLVVLSGGQDSTTCLFWAQKQYKNVNAISFDYNQRNKTELECARNICSQYGIEHKIIKLDFFDKITQNSLICKDIQIENISNQDKVPNTFVAGRNLFFLSIAAVIARESNISDIITGVSQTDFSGYPDCRDVFIKSLNVTLNQAMDYQFNIITPLMWLNKAEEWMLAEKLGVIDIIKNNTLTCYNGIKGDGCGKCPSCVLRKKGWEEYLNLKSQNRLGHRGSTV